MADFDERGQLAALRRDGKEVFYLSPDNKLMAAAVDGLGAAFQVGVVQPLFEVRPRLAGFQGWTDFNYDVSSDGRRFLVNTLVDEASTDPITLLVNGPALLARR